MSVITRSPLLDTDRTHARGTVEVSCLRAEGVSVHAMCLSSITRGRTGAAPVIRLRRYRLQVVWIDAGTIAAEMIQLAPLWYRSYGHLVGDTMGIAAFTVRYPEEPVASVIPRRGPFPTTVSESHLAPEAPGEASPLIGPYDERVAIVAPSLVMHRTPATSRRSLAAARNRADGHMTIVPTNMGPF